MKISLFIKTYDIKAAKGQPHGSFFEEELEDQSPAQLCQLAHMWTDDFEARFNKPGLSQPNTVAITVNNGPGVVKEFINLADLQFKISKAIPEDTGVIKSIGAHLASAATLSEVAAIARQVSAPTIERSAERCARTQRNTPAAVILQKVLTELRSLIPGINISNEQSGQSAALGTIKLGKVIVTAARVLKGTTGNNKLLHTPRAWKNGQFFLVFDEFEQLAGYRYTLYTKDGMKQGHQYSYTTFKNTFNHQSRNFIETITKLNAPALSA